MKCIICHGQNIIEQPVREEIESGNDIVFVTVRAQVCQTCGERYYSRQTMKYLEDAERQLQRKEKQLREVGRVLVFE